MDLIPIDLSAIYRTDNNQTIIQNLSNGVCSADIMGVFLWWILPFLLFMLLLLILKYKDFFLSKILRIKSNRGYIKIVLRRENKFLKEFLVKVDTYGNFRFQKRRYTIENLQDFLIGYDKNKFPVYFYDYQFILPLTLTKKKIDDNLRKLLKPSIEDDKELDDMISQFSMKINPSILDLVYSRKLLSDLYSISGSEDFKQKLIIVGLIVGGLIIMYYTGLLTILLGFLGINIPTG